MSTQSRTFPSSAIITTEKAAFHITIKPHTNYKTKKVDSYKVGIGSRSKKQLYLTVPMIESGKTKGKFMWVNRVGPVCYLDSTRDSTNLSKHILELGFTIAKDINPTCLRYTFNDYSSFPCYLPGRIEKDVPMKVFHIAFYGKTWYEMHFGARMKRNHDTYEKLKSGRSEPPEKPTPWYFVNTMLEEIMTPIMSSSKTWGEFFNTIQDTYGDKKCAVVYPWIMSAVISMFDHSNIFDSPKWYIDISGITSVPFRTYEDILVERGTRKRKYQELPFDLCPVYFRHIPQIQKFDYYKFLGIK